MEIAARQVGPAHPPAPAGAYQPAAWVRVLGRVAVPAVAVAVGGSIGGLLLTGHANVALLGLPATLVAVGLMRRLPRRLLPINHLGNRDLRVVEREAGWTVAVALLHPIAIIPVVLLVALSPTPMLGEYSRSPLLSLEWAVLAKLLLLALPCIALAARFGSPLRQLGLRRVEGTWRWVGPIVPVALLCAGLALLTGDRSQGVPWTVVAALFLTAFIDAGFPEEAFYRCLLQTRLELLIGSPGGVAVSSVLFGLRHLPTHYAFIWRGTTGGPATDLLLSLAVVLAYQAVFGVLFGYMWMRYRNAWANMLGHTLFDAFAFMGLLVSS